MKKRIISLVTSIMMAVGLVGYIPTESVSAENNSPPYISNEVNVEGTNSFGTMLADVLEGEQTEQEANNGHNVFSIEMNGKEADVEFQTLTDCTLVVAVYDETGETLVATGSTEVTTEMEETTVNIEVKEMPEYFYLRGFLIEENTFRPLCTAYESNIYTKEMQEFLAKTTDDFDKELVLNLDEDKTNNFAVFSEDTVIVNEGTTKLVSANDTTLTYVFENADAQMKALKKDDVFAFEKTDGEVLIVKVASVATSGTKLTITGQDTELEDVFDYVKIDTEAEDEDISIDTSAPLEEGITYLGEVDYNSYSPDEYGIQTMAWEDETTVETGFSFKLEEKTDNVSLSGKIAVNFKMKLKFYLALTKQNVELSISSSAKLSVELRGKLEKDISLLPLGISPLPGVYIDLTPKFSVSASVSVTASGELETVCGFKLEGGKIKDISKAPSFSSEVDINGKIFLGLKIEPKISIISEDVCNGKITAKLGLEWSASPREKNEKEGEKHTCDFCIQGTKNWVLELKASVKAFNNDHLKFEITALKMKEKICDFYYSETYKEGGEGSCPHNLYLVTIIAHKFYSQKDGNTATLKSEPAVNAQIIIKPDSKNNDSSKYEFMTDEEGKVKTYLKKGKYYVDAKSVPFDATDSFEIDDEAIELPMTLENHTITLESYDSLIGNNGTSGDTGGNTGGSTDSGTGGNKDIKIEENRLDFGEAHSAYIDDNGNLYMWGNKEWGQLGDGADRISGNYSSIPKKIMKNVKMVSLGAYHSAAITTDGSLYTWGYNWKGQLGDGTGGQYGDYSSTPIKIMDNVKSVSLEYMHSAAITTDGSLYVWGWNEYGQLGDGTTNDRYTPVKIMDNVKQVSLGDDHSAAITEDGSLYMWGNNSQGQLGDGTGGQYGDYSSTPIKIMDNVKSISLGMGHSAAITTDGSLYMWGDNWFGGLGDGSTEDRYTPVKIMDNVKSVSLGAWHTAAITTDGSLYMWGDNYDGQLGDGTTEDKLTPVKIMNNVKSVSLGWQHSGAITTDGSLYMWGLNDAGQLGDGTIGDKNVPTKVTIPSEASAISLASNEIMPLALINEYPAFSDLLPNTVYNIYAVQSRNAEEPLCSANLLFISQAVSNENGEIYGNFRPFAETENMEWFCVPMAQTDISGAEVTLPEYEYTGEEQFVKPVVTLDDKVLTEGDDYYLEGDYSFTKPGEYEVTVRGTGLYTGKVSVQYTVGGLVGDINFDSTINMKDLAALQRYLNGWEAEINEAAADLDSDDKITMKDLVALQRITNGWEN